MCYLLNRDFLIYQLSLFIILYKGITITDRDGKRKGCYRQQPVSLSDPKGIRTPITAVKGRGPNH